MNVVRAVTCLVLMVLGSGCFRDLVGGNDAKRASGADNSAATRSDGSDAGDAGDEPPSSSDGDAGTALPPVPAFPYRWRANGPKDTAPLGGASFFLRCEDTRTGEESEACGFLCRSEHGEDDLTDCDRYPPEPCAEVVSDLGYQGKNRFCVTVLQPADDKTTYQTSEHTSCWEWESEPFPYRVSVGAIPSNSTRLEVALDCERIDPATVVVGERLKCLFECSIDKEPFSLCNKKYVRDNVEPGEHKLRVRLNATVPPDSFEFFLDKAIEVPFTIAEDATPPITRPTLPPVLPVSELGILADLIAPYTEYAHDCGGARRESASYGFVRYASIALGRAVEPDPELVEACRVELERLAVDDISEDACMESMGIGDDMFWQEAILPVRLPFACTMLSLSPPTMSGQCFTHAECKLGICQPLSSISPLGVCFSADPGEGSLCSAAGCSSDEYCAGICRPRQSIGGACTSDYECLYSATCDNGRCIKLRCENEACLLDAQCASGACIDQRCQEPKTVAPRSNESEES